LAIINYEIKKGPLLHIAIVLKEITQIKAEAEAEAKAENPILRKKGIKKEKAKSIFKFKLDFSNKINNYIK